MSQKTKLPAAAAALPPPAPLTSLQEWLDLPTNSETSISLIQALDPQPYVEDFWKQSTRPDGRLFAQCRPTKVVFGMFQHSAGSALVTQQSETSSTKILATTSLQVGQPAPEQPDHGEVIVQVSGTGGQNLGQDLMRGNSKHWDVLTSWLQRMLSEGDLPSRLNLLTGKACLRLVVSVLILEDGGNLMDAALLACMAAWKDTRLPKVGEELVESQGKLWWKEDTAMMSSAMRDERKSSEHEEESPRDYRIALTMGIHQSANNKIHLLVDPSSQEEPFLDGTLTVTVETTSEKLQVEYAGKAALSPTDLALAAKLAKARAAELSNVLST